MTTERVVTELTEQERKIVQTVFEKVYESVRKEVHARETLISANSERFFCRKGFDSGRAFEAGEDSKVWAERDTAIRELARPFLSAKEIDGDSFGVPTMVDVVESLCKKLREAEQVKSFKVG